MTYNVFGGTLNIAQLNPVSVMCIRSGFLLLVQVGPLSQAIHAAACISFGRNISAKRVLLTSLYPTALMLKNDDFTVLRHYVCT